MSYLKKKVRWVNASALEWACKGMITLHLKCMIMIQTLWRKNPEGASKRWLQVLFMNFTLEAVKDQNKHWPFRNVCWCSAETQQLQCHTSPKVRVWPCLTQQQLLTCGVIDHLCLFTNEDEVEPSLWHKLILKRGKQLSFFSVILKWVRL